MINEYKAKNEHNWLNSTHTFVGLYSNDFIYSNILINYYMN